MNTFFPSPAGVVEGIGVAVGATVVTVGVGVVVAGEVGEGVGVGVGGADPNSKAPISQVLTRGAVR